MKKGSRPLSAKKMNRGGNKQNCRRRTWRRKKICDCPICKKACSLAGLKDHTKGFRVVLSYHRDGRVTFTHLRCGTRTKLLVDNEAYERGIVIARCSGCDDLLPVADHARWIGDGKPETLERMLFASYGTQMLPKGSDLSFCATFQSPHVFARVKLPKGVFELLSFCDDLGFLSSTRRDVKAQSVTNGGSNLEVQSEIDGGSILGAQPGMNGGNNPEEQSRMNRRSISKPGTDGDNNPKEDSGTDGGSNPNAQSGTNGGSGPKEEQKKKKKKSKKKDKKSQEITDQCYAENNNNDPSTPELNPEFDLVQNRGSNSRVQGEMKGGSISKAEPGTNGGTDPKTQSEINGGSDTRKEQKNMKSKKKKSHGRTDQYVGGNNTNGSSRPEFNPEFVLVQKEGSNPRVQSEMNSGSNPKEQPGTNGESILKLQPGTGGGSNPKTQSETNGGGDTRKEQKNMKSKKKKPHGRTGQFSGGNNTNGLSNPEFGPEFVLMQNGGSSPRAHLEMNSRINHKQQSGTTGGSIPKAQPGKDGGSNPKAQPGKPKEDQKNEKSKKKKKSLERTDQCAGENKNRDGSSCPAFDPEFVLVQNSIRDATVEFTHPLCNTQSERLVNMEAFNRGVVVVRCGGCDDLVAVADHTEWFGEDGEHEKVEMLLGFLGVDVLKGSDQSVCATFERQSPPKTNRGN